MGTKIQGRPIARLALLRLAGRQRNEAQTIGRRAKTDHYRDRRGVPAEEACANGLPIRAPCKSLRSTAPRIACSQPSPPFGTVTVQRPQAMMVRASTRTRRLVVSASASAGRDDTPGINSTGLLRLITPRLLPIFRRGRPCPDPVSILPSHEGCRRDADIVFLSYTEPTNATGTNTKG